MEDRIRRKILGLAKEPRWRELRLEEGNYAVRIWKKVKNDSTGREEFVIEEEYTPTRAGLALEFIPFFTVNPEGGLR